ncbi:MAG: hypothetical protein KU29_09425 [Sulfurovum sp. FS06-10]|nr:MAG: hypothetical protein KU29_09425 [Sulfurovum sp. FS06-10]
MKHFIKYLLLFLGFLLLLFYYLIRTTTGNEHVADYLTYYLSKKTNNEIVVSSLILKNYPHLTLDMTINKTAKVQLVGEANIHAINMEYHLKGDTLQINNFVTNKKVDIVGHLSGSLSGLLVTGKGSAFTGSIEFDGIKTPQNFQDTHIALQGVESEDVLTFLKKKPMVQGRANIDVNLTRWSNIEEQGMVVYRLKNGMLPAITNVPVAMNAEIKLNDVHYTYGVEINSTIGTVSLINGGYDKPTKVIRCAYTLDINDVSSLEALLKHKYKGGLKASGNLTYDKGFRIEGSTEKLGGNLQFMYNGKSLDLDLYGVSLVALLEQYDYPTLLQANLFGTINYNIPDKIIVMNSELKQAKFRRNQITDMVFSTTGIDMLKNVYDKSTFIGGFQEGVLSSILKLDDGKNHFYLTDTKMNSIKNTINSNFEIKIEGQELLGNIYGNLQNPQVNVNVKRLLKYQVGKQIEGWLSNEQKQEIKNEINQVSETLKNIDVKEEAKSLLNRLF